MPKINDSFPPPSIKEDDKVVVRASAVLSGLLMFGLVALMYAVILNGLYAIAENGGVVDWTLSFVDIFLGVLFVQFIRVLDAVWKKRLQ
jgi:hypothetical protein